MAHPRTETETDLESENRKKGIDHLILALIVMALWFSSALLCLSDISQVLMECRILVAGLLWGWLFIYLLLKMIIQKGRRK